MISYTVYVMAGIKMATENTSLYSALSRRIWKTDRNDVTYVRWCIIRCTECSLYSTSSQFRKQEYLSAKQVVGRRTLVKTDATKLPCESELSGSCSAAVAVLDGRTWRMVDGRACGCVMAVAAVMATARRNAVSCNKRRQHRF